MVTDRGSDRSGGGSPARSRTTRQFQAVLEELAASGDFRSAQDIHAAMRGRGATVGLATVYRALQTLAGTGEADVLRTAAGESLYRDCGDGHHHHLVCRECGRTVEVRSPTVESWADGVAAEHDFSEVSHTVELLGTCARCRA